MASPWTELDFTTHFSLLFAPERADCTTGARTARPAIPFSRIHRTRRKPGNSLAVWLKFDFAMQFFLERPTLSKSSTGDDACQSRQIQQIINICLILFLHFVGSDAKTGKRMRSRGLAVRTATQPTRAHARSLSASRHLDDQAPPESGPGARVADAAAKPPHLSD